MQLLAWALFFVHLCWQLSTVAASIGAVQTNWQQQDNFLSHRSLGAACNAIRNIRIDPPCNPAFLGLDSEGVPEEREGLLSAQLLLGDTYKYFYKNRDLFNESDKRALIEELFSHRGSVGLDSSIQLWWKENPFVIGIEPLRLHSYSEVINSAYPDIFMEGIYQQSLFFLYGTSFKSSSLNKNPLLGIKVSLLERQIISEHFYLFDALNNLDDYFQVKKQKAIMIEPGFSWDLSDENSEWNPLLSLKFSQIGFVDQKIDSLPMKTYADFGLSIAPTVFSKNFETAINYRTNSDKELLQNLSLAFSLSLTCLQIYLDLEKETSSLGLSTRWRNWSSGIIFQQQKTLLEGSAKEISFLEFRILI